MGLAARKLRMTAPAAGGGGGPASVTYVAETSSGVDGASYTFSSHAIGVADADRTVVVCVAARKAGASTTISGVTVGGVSATELAQVTNNITNTSVAGMYAIDVASGTTADIVVTFGASMLRCSIGVWRCTGISTTANDTATSTGSTFAGSVDNTADGAVIGVAGTGSINTFAWTGATESYDVQVGGELMRASGVSDEVASAGTLSISATVSGSFENVAVYAAW